MCRRGSVRSGSLRPSRPGGSRRGNRLPPTPGSPGPVRPVPPPPRRRLPAGESVATYTRILELDPTDPSALEAAVRLAIGPSRRGEVPARRAAIAALRSLSALAHDEATRIATDLRLGLLLEAHAMDAS